MVEGDSVCSFFERSIEGTVEMKLEQADASDTTCVQKLPVLLGQEWLFLDWQLPLQGPQDTFEHQAVFFLRHIVTREMDIDAPAGQLRIDFPKRAHFIGTYQNMADSRGILKVFEMI